ncbi:MAG: hypothetical protein AAFX09_06735 [Pseudomonadota bacterium]
MTPGAKRYTRWFLFWMVVYSVAVLGSSSINDRFDLADPVRLALALIPVAPALFALREFVIFLRSLDEVQSRIQSEAILIAAGMVGFTSFAWGFAELWMDWPRLPVIMILPALIAAWGLALPLVSRRYK